MTGVDQTVKAEKRLIPPSIVRTASFEAATSSSIHQDNSTKKSALSEIKRSVQGGGGFSITASGVTLRSLGYLYGKTYPKLIDPPFEKDNFFPPSSVDIDRRALWTL